MDELVRLVWAQIGGYWIIWIAAAIAAAYYFLPYLFRVRDAVGQDQQAFVRNLQREHGELSNEIDNVRRRRQEDQKDHEATRQRLLGRIEELTKIIVQRDATVAQQSEVIVTQERRESRHRHQIIALYTWAAAAQEVAKAGGVELQAFTGWREMAEIDPELGAAASRVFLPAAD